MTARWIVTTSAKPSAALQERAQRVALRSHVPLAPRRGSLASLLEAHEAAFAYVVTHANDRLDDGSAQLFVHPGLLHARLQSGLDHPLVQAVTAGLPARRIIDGTLGLGIDALHLAEATGAHVLGIEQSPAVRSLCLEGLPRLAAEGWAGAQRVQAIGGLTHEVLRILPSDSADAVFLAPMFDAPAATAPGWDLLRPLAYMAPVDDATRQQALRVAPRVAVKLSPADAVPACLADADIVRSKALRYAVLTRRDRAAG